MKPSAIFLRGLAMGAADIVPGVSGGTIAFISGIYPTLLASIKSFDLSALKMLCRGELPELCRHVNGGFLLALLLGIATSIFSLARLLSWVLTYYPEPLWGFFFGLILASACVLLGQVDRWRSVERLLLLMGVGIALLIAVAPRTEFLPGMPGVFLAGFIAICATILPGISGSFILVLLGMYSLVLGAVKDIDVVFLLVLATGAVSGLMVFSRLLHWLLEYRRSMTLALLTGFMFGSLATIWPWKRVVDWVVSSSGTLRPAQQFPVMPSEYLARTGQDPMFLYCVLLALAAAALVLMIDRKWGKVRAGME